MTPQDTSWTSPTVLRIMIGSQLRQLRQAAGLTCEEAGGHIRVEDSTISRMENGKVPFNRPRAQRNVADLLTVYGVTDDHERTRVLGLIKESGKPGWWEHFGDVLPSWFQTYIGLEGAATRIRISTVQLVPGLFQTEDYARAVLTAAVHRGSAEDIERRVKLRMTRQDLLTRSDAPTVWAVVDEGALRRLVGSSAVMRAQLERLIGLAALPNVTLQVLPHAVRPLRVVEGAFIILRFAEAELPDVVYLEQFTSAVYLDKPRDIEKYAQGFSYLSVGATQPAATAEFLGQILQEVPDDS